MGLQWDKPSTNWCRISSIHSIFLKFDFLSPPAAHTYLLQETTSEQNQFPSLFSTITLPQKTCSMDWYFFFDFFKILKKMSTSSQYSGQSSPLWPFGHYFSMTIFSVFGVFTNKLTNGGLSMSIYFTGGYTNFWDTPNSDPFLKEAFVFFGQTDCRGLYDMLSAKQHKKQQWQHWTLSLTVGESLQSSMVSRRRVSGWPQPAILELKNIAYPLVN